MENFKHPLHLKIPELQTSDEVTDAVAKQERLTGEDLPNDPAERLEAYMARLEKVFLNPDERVKERNLEMLRPAIYDAYIIKPQDVPESYFELQQQVARERGQPVEVIPPNHCRYNLFANNNSALPSGATETDASKASNTMVKRS